MSGTSTSNMAAFFRYVPHRKQFQVTRRVAAAQGSVVLMSCLCVDMSDGPNQQPVKLPQFEDVGCAAVGVSGRFRAAQPPSLTRGL